MSRHVLTKEGSAVHQIWTGAFIRCWVEFNAVYVEYLDRAKTPPPSASGASGLAPGGEVELDRIGYWPHAR